MSYNLILAYLDDKMSQVHINIDKWVSVLLIFGCFY